MPIIDDSRTINAQPSAFRPRVSTPGPAVPRWGDNTQTFDFGSLLQQTVGTYEQAPKTDTGLSLSRLGLSLAPASEWGSAYAPVAEYKSPTASTAATSAAKMGGYGPDAYGFLGPTGQPQTRGSSPYGFQAPMWASLSAAFKAMKAAGLGTPGITDGFRSYASQVAVKAAKGDLAATPGRSVHGLGLAADLRLTKAQQAWLERNGARYNLVRLPSEPWHWQLTPSAWGGFS